jgi:hydrogenase maturation protein HypF
VVQGVGFRPFVYRLATAHGLSGLVRNDGEGVWIEVEGDAGSLARFSDELCSAAPPLSRIDAVESTSRPLLGQGGFRIELSGDAGGAANLPADVATCAECLRELRDPSDRRYRYPFINCTDCGPRFTLARELPWDRPRTTMSTFPLCRACRAEYEDPTSRRFHAEPNACPACGPRLMFRRSAEREVAGTGEDALALALETLRGGGILAVKGLGGFLLAVDPTDEDAVLRLRERKHRPHKPLALMARDLDAARRLVHVDSHAEAALELPLRPVVLLPAQGNPGLAPSVAPGLRELGVMLPYTPLHHLLLEEDFQVLVMTSGNRSEEPIARTDEDAFSSLSRIAEAFLFHDREIHARADDSVVRLIRGAVQPVRRARGYVPSAILLPFEAPPVLAVGPELKSTVCVTRGSEAILSTHIGDLEYPEAFAFFEESIDKLTRLLAIAPQAVAHDLHPDYQSTRWARRCGLRAIPVQHHHAHIASCLAEHGRVGPAIGVAFDGTGCGVNGELWGGEILWADLAGFRRLARLRPLPLPGGEVAIRQVWRLAVSAALDAGVSGYLPTVPEAARLRIERLVAHDDLCPRASGAGRWFDAVAALCAVRDEVSYEGQAAMELEALAADAPPVDPLPFDLTFSKGGAPDEIDLRPTVRAVVAALRAGRDAAGISAAFHATLSHAVAAACRRARESTGLGTVALSGGCFQNARLTHGCLALLEADGFEALIHRKVPPNDGGVSLGQAAVAAWRLRREQEKGNVSRHPR